MSTFYKCGVLDNLPHKGEEIFYVTCFCLFIICLYTVTYVDVVAKQIFRSFLDPRVAARVAEIQKMLPNLTLTEDKKEKLYTEEGKEYSHHAVAEDGQVVEYDTVVSQGAYIERKCVDEELMIVSANCQNYWTISDNSSATSRGYSMLNAILPLSGFSMSFLLLANLMVAPFLNDWISIVALITLPLGITTAIIMDHSPSSAVFRKANIMLFTNYPYDLPDGKSNPISKLHVFGVVAYCFIPAICHTLQLSFKKDKFPPEFVEKCTTILLAVLAFGIGFLLFLDGFIRKIIPSIPVATCQKLSILFETLSLFGCGYINIYYETYGIAACVNKTTELETFLIAAFFGPLLLVAKRQIWSPMEYCAVPSLMLMRRGVPTAVMGPTPAEEFQASVLKSEKKSQELLEEGKFGGGNNKKILPRIQMIN